MKNTVRTGIFTLIAGLAMGISAQAAATLKIGDPAPKLDEGRWIQGEPVKNFETGKVYIVEFWATWCGPCRASIPHLNALYQEFKNKGVVVIGQDVWEQDESGVAPFVKKMGTNMTYRVALDDKSEDSKGAMATTWMEAAGRDGIPSAFIINQQGRIAWIGHPMEMNAKLLDDILSGHYDLAKAAADHDKAEANQKHLQELGGKLQAAMQSQNWDQANAVVDEIEKTDPDSAMQAQMIRFQILLAQKKYDDAFRLAQTISDAHPDEAELQGALAWILSGGRGLEKPDPVLAEKIAERANKAASGKNPEILDVLARTEFMNGKKQDAIATEQKAVDVAETDQRTELQSHLKSYQDGKLPGAGE